MEASLEAGLWRREGVYIFFIYIGEGERNLRFRSLPLVLFYPIKEKEQFFAFIGCKTKGGINGLGTGTICVG